MDRNTGAAMPAASTPAPLMIRRRDGIEFPLDFVIVLPFDLPCYFLISAGTDLRVSFCEHWSNGVASSRRRVCSKCHNFTILKGRSPVVSSMTDTPVRADTWHEIVLATLKSNNVKLVTYVPDRVFTPLIKALHDDAFFTTFAATREEEAVGIVAGAWMGGMRGAV